MRESLFACAAIHGAIVNSPLPIGRIEFVDSHRETKVGIELDEKQTTHDEGSTQKEMTAHREDVSHGSWALVWTYVP